MRIEPGGETERLVFSHPGSIADAWTSALSAPQSASVTSKLQQYFAVHVIAPPLDVELPPLDVDVVLPLLDDEPLEPPLLVYVAPGGAGDESEPQLASVTAIEAPRTTSARIPRWYPKVTLSFTTVQRVARRRRRASMAT
jgi:hypothetical protein